MLTLSCGELATTWSSLTKLVLIEFMAVWVKLHALQVYPFRRGSTSEQSDHHTGTSSPELTLSAVIQGQRQGQQFFTTHIENLLEESEHFHLPSGDTFFSRFARLVRPGAPAPPGALRLPRARQAPQPL